MSSWYAFARFWRYSEADTGSLISKLILPQYLRDTSLPGDDAEGGASSNAVINNATSSLFNRASFEPARSVRSTRWLPGRK